MDRKARLVVLSGAGMSADSGLKTFRDSDGLWEGHRVEDVATPEAWAADPAFVLQFYNERRRSLLAAEPNDGHRALARLEDRFNVTIVTQNVDDLHERAGSSNVIHLHGELRKSRSTADETLIYDIDGSELSIGDLCELGSQLRPHIVWFGEAVPEIERAAKIVAEAETFIVVGTSLAVYPAAGLVRWSNAATRKYVIDPAVPRELSAVAGFHPIPERASVGCARLAEMLCRAAS